MENISGKITDKITLTNEDNMALMARYPDNYFDLAIVDPPYGIGASKMQLGLGKSSSATKAKNRNWIKKDWDDITPNRIYFNELFRVSKNQIIWGANYLCEFLPSGTGWIFWNKLNGIGTSFSDGEFAYSSKGIQSKYYECYSLAESKTRIHPTQKPVQLYKWLLQNYAKPNDKILDTHLGSMSIAIACHDLGFELTGCELDEDYFNKGIDRVKKHCSQLSLFEPAELIQQKTLELF